MRSLVEASWRFIHALAIRYSKDGASLMAAAIAFYGLISLFPMAALTISIFGRVLGSSEEAQRQVFDLVQVLLPFKAVSVIGVIGEISRPAGGRWFVESISGLGLLWSGSKFFQTLQEIFSRLFPDRCGHRPFLLRILAPLTITFLACVLFVIIILMSAFAAVIASRMRGAFGSPQPPPSLWAFSFAPIVLTWLVFLLLYQYLPQRRMSWGRAAIGAAVGAALVEIARKVFVIIVGHSAAYGKLYGSLAGIIILTTWIYLTASIMLLGAEIAAELRERALANRAS